MSSTVTIPVATHCERYDCSNKARYAYVVTGEVGKDGVAVYCSDCSKIIDGSENHTAIAEVEA